MDLHEEAEKMAADLGALNLAALPVASAEYEWHVSESISKAADALRALSARLAEVERHKAGLLEVCDTREEIIQRLTRERDKWQQAFAAQSRKLQSVLHIEGIKDALARPEETDALDRIRAEERERACCILNNYGEAGGDAIAWSELDKIAAAIREDKT